MDILSNVVNTWSVEWNMTAPSVLWIHLNWNKVEQETTV